MVSKITLKNDVLLSLIAMVISDPLPSDHAGLRLPLPYNNFIPKVDLEWITFLLTLE